MPRNQKHATLIRQGGIYDHQRRHGGGGADSFSPEIAFGRRLQYRSRGSCHTRVFTWRPRISGRRTSDMERVIAQCHIRAVSLSLFRRLLKTFLFQQQLRV